MKTTSVTIMNSVRRFRAGLASLALIAFAASGYAHNAPPATACRTNNQTACRDNNRTDGHVDAQTAEVEALLIAVHDLTSYNGNPDTAVDHLASWYELWAEDATLVVNGGAPIVGQDAILAFFAGNALFKTNFVGLTPSFRTKISIHGDTAEVYLECIFLTESLTVGPQRSLSGTVRKVHGQWLFWRMANNPAQPLFP